MELGAFERTQKFGGNQMAVGLTLDDAPLAVPHPNKIDTAITRTSTMLHLTPAKIREQVLDPHLELGLNPTFIGSAAEYSLRHHPHPDARPRADAATRVAATTVVHRTTVEGTHIVGTPDPPPALDHGTPLHRHGQHEHHVRPVELVLLLHVCYTPGRTLPLRVVSSPPMIVAIRQRYAAFHDRRDDHH